MQAALDQFSENLKRARILTGLAESLSQLTTEAIDLSDLYRASLVLGVGALDNFVHQFVRLGMVDIHRGKRPITDAYLSFKIPMNAARQATANIGHDDWLNETIRAAHGWLSFQHPDKIAEAIRLMSAEKLWERVAAELVTTTTAVKAQLLAIVDRRNKIAHEADMDPTNPGYRWPIDKMLVEDALDFLERLTKAIYKVAA